MSANLSAVPKLQFFDNNGNPLVGGKLYTYAAGTTTPQATYTDASATTPNTNPIILDSRGEANVWLSATTYKFVLKDSTDATIWTVDNISNSLSLSQILAASGSAASPPYTFASDTDTGMYLAAVGQLGLSVAGTPVLRSTDTQMVIGQSGGSNDVDVVVYGDIDTEGDFNLDGNLNITGAARRITGDFSNATLANRVAFQTSTVNGNTTINAIPNGTGSVSSVQANNTSDPSNGSQIYIAAGASVTQIAADKTGTGTYLPMTFYTGGSERMRIATSGNVGIGTISPGNRLHVSSPLTGTTPRSNSVLRVQSEATGRDVNIQLSDNVTNSAEVGMVSGALYFATAGNERIWVTNSGNVGIGTTSPQGILQVVGSGSPSASNWAYLIAGNVGSQNPTASLSTGLAVGTNFSSGNSETNLVWGQTIGSGQYFSISKWTGSAITEQMRITSTGNVGIGTINPQTKLHVDSGATDEVVRFEGTGSPFISLYDSGTREFFIQTAAEINIWGQANKAMSFATNNIVRAQIAANGSQSSVIPNGSTLYPQFACRAWINFDGTSGSIGTGRGSGNVSSVTDNGAGNYTINFTTAMPDTNYAVTGTANGRNTHPARVVGAGYSGDTFSTSALQIRTGTAGGSGSNGTTEDCEYVFVAIFR